MPKRFPQAILHKVIFQAIYKPYLKFYDLIYSATQKLGGYEHWETNKVYVMLYDHEKHCNLTVQHNIFSYEWDYSGTENYIDDVRDALTILPASLEIETFKRLGLRKQFLIPTKMRFEEINNILSIKFLAQDESLMKLFPSGITDMSYVVVGSDDELQFRIALGPMKQKEIPKHIQINQKYNFRPDKPNDYANVPSGYPDVSVFIDIDVFRRDEDIGIPADYAHTFLKKADTTIENKLTALRNYIFAK